MELREKLIKAIEDHLNGCIALHKANVEIYLTNPAGIGEHSDIVEAIEEELGKIAECSDKLEALCMISERQ